MIRNRTNRTEAIRAALRRGDPAGDGKAPGRDEFAAMRRRILVAATPGRPAWRPYAVAGLAAAMLVVMIAAAAMWNFDRDSQPQSTPSVATGGGTTGARNQLREHVERKVEFTTAGGTRIVWILNSDLQI